MHIKSEKDLSKSIENFFESVSKAMKSLPYGSIMWVVGIVLLAAYVWVEYSGFICFWLLTVGYIGLKNKEQFDVVAVLSVLVMIPYGIGASINVYDGEPTTKEVKIEKYEFVDMSEKIVLTLSDSAKKVFVISDIGSESFFTLRTQNGEPVSVSLSKIPHYDHIDKLAGEEALIEDFNYKVKITIGNESKDIRYTCEHDENNCKRLSTIFG